MKTVAGGIVVVGTLVAGIGIGRILDNPVPPPAPPAAETRQDEVVRLLRAENEQLRREIEENRRVEEEPVSGTAKEPEQAAALAVEEALPIPPRDSLDDVRRALAGELDFANLLTVEEIQATLDGNGRRPEFLLAAANLVADEELARALVEEALDRGGESPMTVSGALQWYLVHEDEERASELAERLDEVDPTNSWASYYLAFSRASDDPRGALEALSEATTRNHFDPYNLTTMDVTGVFFREAGYSESIAGIASAYGLQLGYLRPLRELNDFVAGETARLESIGDIESSLRLIREGTVLGSRLSTAGKPVIQDLVGMACEERMLQIERRLRERAGQSDRVAQIDRHLENNRMRRERTVSLVQGIETYLADITEEEITRYLERLRMDGEVVAILDLIQSRGDSEADLRNRRP